MKMELLYLAAPVVVSEPGLPPLQLTTDYAGRCQYSIQGNTPYEIDAGKPDFYQTLVHQVDPHQQTIELVLAHQQMVRQPNRKPCQGQP